MENEVFVGLDIGTTKIACIITELGENGELKVIGVGVCPSVGLHKGVVVNIDKTVSSIKKAVEEAELMAGVDVDAVLVGIAGDHIRAINSRGVVAIAQEGRTDIEITKEDVDRAIGQAKALGISPNEREILHVIPQEYSVDDQRGVKDPVGMSGARLETQVHIITGAVTSAHNIMKCVEKAGLKVVNLVLEPLASSYAVLDEDEKELGVAMIDIGGGTTDIAIYIDDSIRHSAVIGLGGKYVTKDIAVGLRTPVDKAEEIKRKHGCAFQRLLRGDETFTVPGVGGNDARTVSREELVSIIEPRMEDILLFALEEIKRIGYAEMLGAGVVLTGGGSIMEGVREKAEDVFQMPVKLGIPTRFIGLTEAARSPIHSTGIGLCMYAVESYMENRSGKKGAKGGDGFVKALDNMFKWVKEFF